MSVFIDTNIFVAAADLGEQRTARAAAILRALATEDPFTSDHVVLETWSMIRRRRDWHYAERFASGLRRSPVRIQTVEPVDLERAFALGESWRDQRFDLVDRTSFALMERFGCSRVATFDIDFAVYRYGPDRRLAFEIVT
ncbi:MAG: type II toxin-antitoxin system VapC family toxin [Actinomycetota bacterium]